MKIFYFEIFKYANIYGVIQKKVVPKKWRKNAIKMKMT